MSKTKRTISQWVGAIMSLAGSPLMFVFTLTVGEAWVGKGLGGLIVGLLLWGLCIYLFALLLSKITYFIIK